jgi:large subunit ribosomal protein L30
MAPKKKVEEAVLPKIVVQQVGSPIRRHKKQALYLKALGLGKMNRTRELEANPVVLGLIKKAQHMIRIISE